MCFKIGDSVSLKEDCFSPAIPKESIGRVVSVFSGSCSVEFLEYPNQHLVFLNFRIQR